MAKAMVTRGPIDDMSSGYFGTGVAALVKLLLWRLAATYGYEARRLMWRLSQGNGLPQLTHESAVNEPDPSQVSSAPGACVDLDEPD